MEPAGCLKNWKEVEEGIVIYRARPGKLVPTKVVGFDSKGAPGYRDGSYFYLYFYHENENGALSCMTEWRVFTSFWHALVYSRR